MRRRWVSSVIVVVVVGGSFGAVAETATSKPVDLKLGVTGSPGRAVVAGDIVTVRASIQKLTTTGGAATSFRFLYNRLARPEAARNHDERRQVRPRAAAASR